MERQGGVYMRIFAHREGWNLRCGFVFRSDDGRQIVAPLEMRLEPHEEGTVITEPTFWLEEKEAQQLFMELWREGYRPPKMADIDETLKSKDNHIKFAESVVDRLLS